MEVAAATNVLAFREEASPVPVVGSLGTAMNRAKAIIRRFNPLFIGVAAATDAWLDGKAPRSDVSIPSSSGLRLLPRAWRPSVTGLPWNVSIPSSSGLRLLPCRSVDLWGI